MKQTKVAFILLALCVGSGYLIISSADAQAPPLTPVVVSKVEEQKVQKPVTLVGAAEPNTRSIIASEIAGLVEKFPAQEGDYVKKGDVLAEFQTRPLLIRLREAKAAKSEAWARLELARKNFARFQELYKKGVTSAQQLQSMESDEKAWSAEMSQLQAQIDRYEYDLARSKIIAPFNGYVTRQYTEVGQWIAEGGSVVELIDVDTVEIKVDLPERYINQVRINEKVILNFDALPKVAVEGRIISIVPQAEKEARTFPVKVEVANKDHVIKSGMVARVSFLIGEPALVKLVPKDAIVENGGSKFLYVVNNGTAQPMPVSTGIAYKDLIEVIGPVETGQLVVIRGNERLQPGQPVKIVNQDGLPKES
jgi:RND family efflux transporter MFP subunit